MAKRGAYSLSCTARSIDSLQELQPGDHIRKRGELGEFIDSALPDLQLYTHHMLVVKVLSDSEIKIIHKTSDKRVSEVTLHCEPKDITVLDYECTYTGRDAIARAHARIGEDYNLVSNNCEHFVTEVRTGIAQSVQVQTAVKVGVGVAAGVSLLAAAAAVGGLAYMFSGRKKKKFESDSDDDEHSDPAHQYM